MSKTGKIITWLVVAVVVVGGGIWLWMSGQNNGAYSPSYQAPATTTSQTSNNNQNTSASNADLNSNLAQIDGQMSAMSSDSASINQGINDQPVQQQQP